MLINMRPFFDAVEKNDLTRVKQLLNEGANIDKTDEFGYSSLHLASYKGLNEMARLLIDSDINVDIKDKNGQTALHYVALNNQFDLAELLLEKGANLTEEDVYGNQPLWTAVFNDKGRNDRIDIIKLFLKYGADINHKNKVDKSPADIIRIGGYTNLMGIVS